MFQDLWLFHLQFFNFCIMIQFVPDEMRLNDFKDVNIPTNRKLFVSKDMLIPDSQYSGDEVIDINKRKVDSLSDMAEYDRIMQEEYEKNNETSKTE